MNSPTISFETTSSIYTNQDYLYSHNKYREFDHLSTPADTNDYTLFDDVENPYVTPPSPTSSSPTNSPPKQSMQIVNPYSQSLWHMLRGNNGDEIRKLQKIEEQSISLDQCIPISKISTLKTDKTLSTNASPFSDNLNNRLPSFHNLGPPSANDISSKINFLLPSPIIDKPKSNLPLEKNIKNEVLLPHKIFVIQSANVKNLKLLDLFSLSFQKYVLNNGILMCNKVRTLVFGNVKTLKIINELCLEKLLDDDETKDIEEILYDYLKRVLKVYPSYVQSINLRIDMFKKLKKACRFGSWFHNLKKELLDHRCTDILDLIQCPLIELKQLAFHIREYLSGTSPRVDAILEKILQLFDFNQQNNAYASHSEDIILFLEIPISWKMENKLKWKEICKEKPEDQVAHYFRNEFKKLHRDYSKLNNFINTQISQVANLSTTNIHLARNFVRYTTEMPDNQLVGKEVDLTPSTILFQNNMIKSTYELYSEKIKHQNKLIYAILTEFKLLISSKGNIVEELSQIVLKSSKQLIKITNNINSDVKINKLFELFKFAQLYKKIVTFLFERFVLFVKECIRVIVQDSPSQKFTYKMIIEDFNKMRKHQKQALRMEVLDLDAVTQQLEKTYAIGKVVNRLWE